MNGAGAGTAGVRLGDLANGETSPHLVEGEEVGRCFFVGSTGGRRRLTGSLLAANRVVGGLEGQGAFWQMNGLFFLMECTKERSSALKNPRFSLAN